MKPTWKTQEVENQLRGLSGVDRRESIRNWVCTRCGQKATSFDDALSLKEFSISGFCQSCQDAIFG